MHSKHLHAASISLFIIFISSYIVLEILIRTDILPLNRLPYPKFYENVAGNLKPNVRATAWWNPLLIYKYSTNPDGFRNHGTSEKTDNTVLCIGDSYTFGLGVNDNETFPIILEQQLNSKARKFTVLNSGSMDIGIDDHIEYYKNKGRLLKAKLVIVQFNIYDIDILNGKKEGRPAIKNNAVYHFLKDDVLENDITLGLIRILNENTFTRTLYKFLTETPSLASSNKSNSAATATETQLQQDLGSRDKLLDERYLDATEKLWARYRAKLKDLHDFVVADGSDFLLLIIPDPHQIHEYANAPSAALSDFCRENGIKLEDMTTPFRTLFSELGVNTFLEPLDIHCNVMGNTLIAQLVSKRVQHKIADGHSNVSFVDNDNFLNYSKPISFELELTEDGGIVLPNNEIVESSSFVGEHTTTKREAGGGVRYLTTESTGELFAKATLDLHLTKNIDRASLVFFPHANSDSAQDNRMDVALQLGDKAVSTSTTLTPSLSKWSGFDSISFLENQSSSPTRSVRLELAFLRDAGLASDVVHGTRPHRRLELYLYPARHQTDAPVPHAWQ